MKRFSQIPQSVFACLFVIVALLESPAIGQQPAPDRTQASSPSEISPSGKTATVRIAACQTQSRTIDWRIDQADDVLAAVDNNLRQLETLIEHAAEQQCDALAFPEDTLGLLHWYGMNEKLAQQVLPQAVNRMLNRLGRAAAAHNMYLIVCSDHIETDGATYNTAFFLGRDGKEIGRYHKVCPTWAESGMRKSGSKFPVFPTTDLGTVGLSICYDLVMPETARCLALAGADIIFFPTMGGAAIGDDDIGLQALRVRAAENHVYLVVAFRNSGSMIISPRGKIIATAQGADGLAIADINPHAGREGGDSSNQQTDMRARLFRERNPAAFEILTATDPPVLSKVPLELSRAESGRIMARMLTIGEEEFAQASALAGKSNTQAAIAAFEKLRTQYPATWIDRAAVKRLQILRNAVPKENPNNVFPSQLVNFVVDPAQPVFTGAGPGHWDARIRERGWIMREGDMFRMWYTGFENDSSPLLKLGHATSPDGIHWTRDEKNPIFDAQWIEDMMVVHNAGTYYMFAEGQRDRAQLLTSVDGITWNRIGQIDVRKTSGQPIEPGPYGTPTAWFEDGVWYLFYERRDLGIWLATSQDMKIWTNVQDEPVIELGPAEYDKAQVALNQIVKHNGRYYAYYHGAGVLQPDTQEFLWCTCVAVSTDLIHWEKYATNPLLPLEENKSSGILVHDGEQFLLYTMHDQVQRHVPKE